MSDFAGLSGSLVRFCHHLRERHDFHIGAEEVRDAARALTIVPLARKARVRDALRAVLCSRREECATFDREFDAWFRSTDEALARTASPAPRAPRPTSATTKRDSPRERHERDENAADEVARDDAGVPDAVVDDERDIDQPHWVGARGSRLAVDTSSPVIRLADQAWADAARSLVRALTLGRSRRWRPARRGARFDMRRTLRRSLHTGGEAMEPRWLHHPLRRARMVLLIDGSRSMVEHVGAAWLTATALVWVSRRVEVFTFSTALQQITGDVRRMIGGEARLGGTAPHAWGGGTTIGQCLGTFVREHGQRLLDAHTLVVVWSDGLDVGDPALLRDVMAELRRRAGAVLWVNPLSDTPGYEPTASGMRAVMPFVTLASIRRPDDLVVVGRRLDLRR